jgi:competence protein ComEC
VLSIVWVGGAAWLAWAAGLPAQGIAWVARSCAEVPYGAIDWGDSASAAIVLAVVTTVIVLAAPWVWRRTRLRPLVALAIVASATAFLAPTRLLAWPPPGWLLVACDVGQGDGLVVNNGTHNGRTHGIVVDVGEDPAVIDGCLDELQVSVIDLVVLTHFHSDHVAGLAGVLDGRDVAEIRVSPVKDPEALAHRTDALASAAGTVVRELRAGDVVKVGDTWADVWWPAREIAEGSVANNGSVVLTLHVQGVSILFTGDVEREAAAQVVRSARREPDRWGQVDVLKVAHHGSSNRDDGLLDLIDGRLALISVGADNDYGHPAPALLDAMERRGFDVHRTDLEGDIAVVRESEGALTVHSD